MIYELGHRIAYAIVSHSGNDSIGTMAKLRYTLARLLKRTLKLLICLALLAYQIYSLVYILTDHPCEHSHSKDIEYSPRASPSRSPTRQPLGPIPPRAPFPTCPAAPPVTCICPSRAPAACPLSSRSSPHTTPAASLANYSQWKWNWGWVLIVAFAM